MAAKQRLAWVALRKEERKEPRFELNLPCAFSTWDYVYSNSTPSK